MFSQLNQINLQPKVFEFYTAEVLWNDPHISKKMLDFHVNENLDSASRKQVFIEKSIDWITAHFFVGHSTRICDFGCGPGLYTLGLAQKGASVTGIDFSKNSIEYARKNAVNKNVQINYVLDNYLAYETDEKFDLIIMIMCDFCALNDGQRNVLLKKFHHMLEKDGSILFDAYSLNAFDKRIENAVYEHQLMDGFWSEKDYYGFVNTFKYPDEKVVLDKYTIIEENRTWEVYNWLQYFDIQFLDKELHACGFKISEKFSDVSGSPYTALSDEFAVVVKKGT